MTPDYGAHVKSVIASLLAAKSSIDAVEIRDDLDLRASGLVDSLGFMQLISDLERRLGCRIDLAALSSEDLTKVGPLSRHIAGRRALP